jgi:2-keto-3-deoxy-L-rhamnonate aldolase RhmA
VFNPLLDKLRSDTVTLGLWITLESPSVGEVALALDLDWVVVDTEHGHLDMGSVMNHVRVFRGGTTCVLVRVPSHEPSFIKRALDMGAHGVLVPLVRSRGDAEAAMAQARYPLSGVRGVGGERAVQWGLARERYLRIANDEILVIPIIETREAVEDIEGILAIPGLHAIFVGPADLSASYGHLGEWEGPGIAERILSIVERANEAGVRSGILGRDIDDMKLRIKQGFRMIGLGSDISLMIDSVVEHQEALGKSTKPKPWF